MSTCCHVVALLLTCCCTCRDARAPAAGESAASAPATAARSLWGSLAGQSSSKEEANAFTMAGHSILFGTYNTVVHILQGAAVGADHMSALLLAVPTHLSCLG